MVLNTQILKGQITPFLTLSYYPYLSVLYSSHRNALLRTVYADYHWGLVQAKRATVKSVCSLNNINVASPDGKLLLCICASYLQYRTSTPLFVCVLQIGRFSSWVNLHRAIGWMPAVLKKSWHATNSTKLGAHFEMVANNSTATHCRHLCILLNSV